MHPDFLIQHTDRLISKPDPHMPPNIRGSRIWVQGGTIGLPLHRLSFPAETFPITAYPQKVRWKIIIIKNNAHFGNASYSMTSVICLWHQLYFYNMPNTLPKLTLDFVLILEKSRLLLLLLPLLPLFSFNFLIGPGAVSAFSSIRYLKYIRKHRNS